MCDTVIYHNKGIEHSHLTICSLWFENHVQNWGRTFLKNGKTYFFSTVNALDYIAHIYERNYVMKIFKKFYVYMY